MTPVVQIMIAIGMGIIGALFVTPLAIGYLNNNETRSRNRKNYSDYYCPPGQRCPICLEEMESKSMQYLRCGHALHDDCLREYRKHDSVCPTCRNKF